MRTLKIFDTTLRDGEQSPGVNLNQYEKVEIAKQIACMGVDIMEAGYAASSRGDFLAVERVAKEIQTVSIASLSRANKKDIEIAWEALKGGVKPHLHIVLATSPIHMKHKLRMTPEQVIEIGVESVKLARKTFPEVEFCCEDATRSELPFLAEMIERVIQAGATVINLPDTVGYTTPNEYANLFKYVKNQVPSVGKVTLSAHCHDDLGLAVANTLAAIEAGVDQVEGTINGIGERAGNASLEEIAVALHIRKDVYHTAETKLKLDEITKTSQLVSQLTGMIISPNKAIVGKNAFAHESGIHQDGILKEKSTYEIISPELVGLASNQFVLGKHSGRHALKENLLELGYELSTDDVAAVFETFKQLTETKKEILEEDLHKIVAMHQKMQQDPGRVKAL